MKGHRCYLRRLPKKKTSGKFLFFDTESAQDEMAECEKGYRPKYLRKQNCVECESLRGKGKQCHTCYCDKCEYLKPLGLHCTQCSRCDCKQVWCGKKQHIANYILSQSVCNKCESEEFHPLAKCSDCGSRCPKCQAMDKKGRFKKVPC